MSILPTETINVIKSLQAMSIDPILYGSQGVSIYLGPFKAFSDVDLLVSDAFLREGWQDFLLSLNILGFELVDEHEHEFINHEKLCLNFASDKILVRDEIIKNIHEVVVIEVAGVAIKTLDAGAFKAAYEYSKEDGYRKEERAKNDQHIIDLLDAYLDSHR